MSSADKNLSVFNTNGLPDISKKRFAILVAEWNSEVTERLFEGAYKTLVDYGAAPENIERGNVPGSFELTLGSQWFAQRPDIDAVIALGVVIQGETKHNDYINHAVAQGITNVSLKLDKPVIFGVLTPNTMEQALDRAGGIHGNKGDEAAMTAIKMIGLHENIRKA
ncbi:6,7-dimethyl-8-ribityllumazine synthase [Dyadobacter sediminis]|uniref:6,7-dimethyl-8-ribityllumazine synthase n=1 Tax=Dyadobacter sediminis TaxID=1493691 RepID=A0A5R9K684_9BACT|nr:6,7-dimethyl-8-ribityllumazine synthase [Dyadobacter sediminis]TLU89170.1 6,7-dimethyl-8-ribityllumazine synthase [Dyadobacter sediminis]GGC02223.1 6,7-dimethyl-8-ribityllumazine synthase [Dyadobacter sediminis]